ncbi:MAG: hypothetical protein ACRDN8_18820 [Thermoleophilaceae bacterium]
MADQPPASGVELADDEEDAEPLVPDDAGCGAAELDLEFDEHGAPVERRDSPRPAADLSALPCSLNALNGSWLLELSPDRPFVFPLQVIRGPMRIEASTARLRASGDVYVRRLVNLPVSPAELASPLLGGTLIRRNWYPAYPQGQYRWYFRSQGVSYSGGVLSFPFERRLWDAATQEFTGQDTGRMRLSCRQRLVKPPWAPQRTLQMTGQATIGGTAFVVRATKTSPHHRGCRVEVDVMTGRQWPASALACGGAQTFTFTGVYRNAGMDFIATVNEIDVPEDPELTTAELHNLLATHQTAAAAGDESWRLWLLVGSRDQLGNFGVMFDQIAPHRQGAVGFHDPTLPDNPIIEAGARGQALGDVPLALLRTLIHEAGHAFNLFHPKHDIHTVPVGTTIMNQTGDVIGFATTANPYPCTATMAFDDHNRTSLTHSPDPQVKPGWKQFGWGHSATFAGVGEPTDVAGLQSAEADPPGLRLELELPEQIQRGEFVVATVTVTNTGDQPRRVSAALNLAEGDLWISLVTPAGERVDVRDVVLACGPSRFVELGPGESLSGQLELLYTSTGITFDQPGRYSLHAEFDAGEMPGDVVRSETAQVVVRPAVSEPERELERLTVDDAVGLAFALGDYGAAPEARDKLVTVMDRFADSDTGAASAMVIANCAARQHRDVRAAKVARSPDAELAERALEVALEDRDAATVARLAAAVVSPVEPKAPLIEQVRERISADAGYSRDDSRQADKILDDHLT